MLEKTNLFYVAESLVPQGYKQSQTTEKAEVSIRVAVVIFDENHYVLKWYAELYFYEVCLFVHVLYLN